MFDSEGTVNMLCNYRHLFMSDYKKSLLIKASLARKLFEDFSFIICKTRKWKKWNFNKFNRFLEIDIEIEIMIPYLAF